MIHKNLISLFVALTISFTAYGEELESLCGKTNMEVSNKSFSFTWKITGYGDRLNDTSLFKLSTEPITFSEAVESQLWKFHLNKHGHGVITISAVAAIQESKQKQPNFPTVYTITPEISVADQVTKLVPVVVLNNPVPATPHHPHFGFHNMHKKIDKFSKQMTNFSHQMHLMAGSGNGQATRFKRVVASPDNHHEVPMHPGFFLHPNPTPSKYFTWHNIYPQLSTMLAQADNSQEIKIKFFIHATVSKNEYSNVECS